ncbi:MAG: hypothetical protein AAB646_03165, partial [Patescibacteria group bacterium]
MRIEKIDPEEVERIAEEIRKRKGPPVSFPKEARTLENVTAEPLPMEKAGAELPEAEFQEMEPKKRRYAEGDPIIFEKAVGDADFFNY